MRIVVIGSGYVGLVTGACFSDMGHHVCCFDVDAYKTEQLKKGHVPIFEPGLTETVQRNMARGLLFFTDSIEEALKDCEVCFICVGTPSAEDGSADLQHVLRAVENTARVLENPCIMVVKSTVPVGTCDRVAHVLAGILQERNVSWDVSVVSNPEFLKEGTAIEDFFRPDRIVVGSADPHAIEVMRKLYKPFIANGHAFLVMDRRSSEMSKYASNGMLATRISFMNEVALLCERTGADVTQVRKAVGSDTRIGMPFLYAGVGYGGSCFPKDVRAFIRMGQDAGLESFLMKAVEQVNNHQKNILFERVWRYFDGDLKGRRIAVWGASFKPHTDDIREAPFLTVAKQLLDKNACVVLYDPEASHHAKAAFPSENLHIVSEPYSALENAEALLLLTEWRIFRNPDFERMRALMKNPVVFDGRNQYELEEMKTHGFRYFGIGRGGV
jgi:UDPglucose 6-dehydrogenase